MTHPYAELEDLDVWRTLDREIAVLEGSRDVALSTDRQFVVGALAKRLVDEGLVVARKPASPAGASALPGARRDAAATAAVILRVVGVLLLLPVLFGVIMQVVILTKNPQLAISPGSAAFAMTGFLIYLVPGILLIWFAKPIGRFLAKGI